MLLLDAPARYDDLHEGQLGDVLFASPSDSNRHFWVRMRSRRRRQARRPGHRAQLRCRLMVDSVQRAMERLLAAAPEVLAALACGFAAAGPSCSRTGSRGNVAGGGVGARPPPLWGQHSSAQPPDFRAVAVQWLVTPSLQLVASTPRAPSGRSPPGPSARSEETPPTSGRTACGRGRGRRSSTPTRRVPSTRRRCSTPPRGRTSRISLSQLS